MRRVLFMQSLLLVMCVALYPPKRGNCSMQAKLQQMAPVPVTAVYIEKPGSTLNDTLAVLKQMKAEGFTGLKQILLAVPVAESPESILARTKTIYHAALDIGLPPWFYGAYGGWECFTEELLEELGLPLDVGL